MRNMHPADELAMIRADIHRLQNREAVLRRGFLEMRLPCRGDEAVATVKILKKRHFCRERLPEHLLQDDSLWETRIIRQVCVDSTRSVAGRTPVRVGDDDGFEVIERF